MKKLLSISIGLLFTCLAVSQTEFKEGYYIHLEGDTITGYIKDYDWKINPLEVVFKKELSSQEEKIAPHQMLQFEMYNTSRYISRLVDIDVSDDRVARFSDQKPALFEKQHLLLKQLVEGEASLYAYETAAYKRYFIETKSSGLQQLVFKKYKNSNDQILENNRFRQQLLLILDSDKVDAASLKNLKYHQKQLMKVVQRYNSSFDSFSKDFTSKSNKKSFFVSLRPGIQMANITTDGPTSIDNRKYNNEFSFRFGVELEYVLPYKNRKWALFFEPNYQSYSSKLAAQTFIEERFTEVDYQSVLLNLGVRHYFYLSAQHQLFINAGFTYDLPFDSFVGGNAGPLLDVTSSFNFFGGVGYLFSKKFSVELRVQTNRDILPEYVNRSGEFNSFELVFGYKLW